MITRRHALGALAGTAFAQPARAERPGTTNIDITGVSPSLSFAMPATPDGKVLTQDSCKGAITMLYFGYTFCPDVCPLVMQNTLAALAKAADSASAVRFLFVTVDPGRDTIPVLTEYTHAFGHEFTGLRGDADSLERLTRRFRIAWSVTPSDDPRRYEVTHSAAIYVFDRQLNARLLVPTMATDKPDIDGLASDLVRLGNEKPSWRDWFRGLV